MKNNDQQHSRLKIKKLIQVFNKLTVFREAYKKFQE